MICNRLTAGLGVDDRDLPKFPITKKCYETLPTDKPHTTKHLEQISCGLETFSLLCSPIGGDLHLNVFTSAANREDDHRPAGKFV